VVVLHGLTATRRYVVMGSQVLARAGLRAIAYDARAHGASSPAPAPSEYGYDELTGDLRAVLDELHIERAVLAGASMGAHTALAFALASPSRVAALCLITPAYDPDLQDAGRSLERWDALAAGLRTGGVEGFVRAYDLANVPEQWRRTVETVLRQRLSAHEHPAAVADALETVPRSRPFSSLGDLDAIAVPAIVVGSRDVADPGHPLALAQRYAAALPRARLQVEDEGRSPIAWQGGALSRLIVELASAVDHS
jgi:pimeloyl-ACP methyl ester carboxylesterase